MIAALATIRGASNDQSQLLRQQNRCMNFSNLPLVTSRTPAISSPILTLTEESCCPKPASLWFRLQPTVEMSESYENECRGQDATYLLQGSGLLRVWRRR